jgi:hypothetical protein
MKRKILAIMVCLGFYTVLSAQTPPIPDIGTVNNANARTVKGLNKQLNPPLAPATLLLLGLGASVTGYRIYRNTKQNKD